MSSEIVTESTMVVLRSPTGLGVLATTTGVAGMEKE